MKALFVVIILVLFGLTAYKYGTFDREKPVFKTSKNIFIITCGDKNHLDKHEVFIPSGIKKSEFIEGYCKSIQPKQEQDNE